MGNSYLLDTPHDTIVSGKVRSLDSEEVYGVIYTCFSVGVAA